MKAPAGLANTGKALWRSITASVDAVDHELDEREAKLLEMACRQADTVASLETATKRRGVMVPGSTGQPVLNPAIAEARQGRLVVSRLLGELRLDVTPAGETQRSQRARRAAESRWFGREAS